MVAPDLWSIRSASFGVPAWALDAAAIPPLPTPWLGGGLPSAPGSLAAVALWDRALANFRQATGKADGAERTLADDASPQLALDLGFDAIAKAVRYRQLALAERVLADLAAHLAIDPSVVGDQPQALHQACQWRFWAAELAGLRRQWRDALAHALHALAAAERLVALTGESPEALRDWSVSLEKVGDVQRALGDVAGARERYAQSLQVRERLVTLTGESPEVLRDWLVSLIKVGDVQHALGDVAGARGRYAQSLQVSERLVKLKGESPEALRDLAIALERLGDLAQGQGETDAARQFYLRVLAAAEAALRQSPLSKDIDGVLAGARSRLAALNPPPDPAPT